MLRNWTNVTFKNLDDLFVRPIHCWSNDTSMLTEIQRNNWAHFVLPFKVYSESSKLESETVRSGNYDFLLVIHSNCGPIS